MTDKDKQISEITLFISTLSKKCIPPYEMVTKNNLPIRMVRLDTEEIREQAMSGEHIRIRGVPSLVIIYNDGDFQLFETSEKICMCLRGIFAPPPSAPPRQNHQISQQQPSIKEKKVMKKGKKKHINPPSDFNNNTPRKSSHQIEDIGPVDIEFIGDDNQPPPTGGLLLGKSSPLGGVTRGTKMKDIMALAKQMERDRQASLGYSEDKLPKSY